jgi:hypothetical protein
MISFRRPTFLRRVVSFVALLACVPLAVPQPAARVAIESDPLHAEVAKSLESGGVFYSIQNIDGAIDGFLDTFMKVASAFGNTPAPAIAGAIVGGVRASGIPELRAFGTSIVELEGGGYRSVSITKLRKRTGLFALAENGSKDSTLLPGVSKDFVSFSWMRVRVQDVLPLVRAVAKRALGMVGEGFITNGLKIAKEKQNIDVEALLATLGNEFVAASMRVESPDGPRPSEIAMIETTSNAIFKLLVERIKDSDKFSSALTERGEWQVLEVSVKDEKTYLAQRGASVLAFVRQVEHLDTISAAFKSSSSRYTNHPDYKRWSKGLPTDGFLLQFATKEFGELAVAQLTDPFIDEKVPNLNLFKPLLENVGKRFVGSRVRSARVTDDAFVAVDQTESTLDSYAQLGTGTYGVAVGGIVIAVAVPAFLRARANARGRACQENLVKMDGAKEQYALEKNMSNGSVVEMKDLVGDGQTGYLRATPTCPSGGEYTLGPIGTDPKCSFDTTNQPFTPHSLEHVH